VKDMRKDNGQVLVFVVATMAIALAVGISFSLRTLSSLSRTSTTDTSSRVLAAAEGGAERYLSKTISELDAKVGQQAEVIQFVGTSNDNISTKASVTVSKYGQTGPPDKYTFAVKQGKVAQINLSGYNSSNLDLCWISTQPGVKDSDLYYSVYTSIPTTLKKLGVKSFVSHVGFPSGYSNNFETSSANNMCGSNTKNYYRITGLSAGPGFVKYIRFYSINNDSIVEIYPSGSIDIPFQGYRITSVGELNNIVSNQKVTKTVSVLRPLPYLPAMFDFGIYSDSGTVQ